MMFEKKAILNYQGFIFENSKARQLDDKVKSAWIYEVK